MSYTPQPMQPTLPEPTPQPPPIYLQRPPQSMRPNRPSTSCGRHPQEHFSGFCPSCLRERLTILDSNNAPLSSSSSSTRNPTTFFSMAPSLNASFRSFASNSQSNRLSLSSSFFSLFRRTMSLSHSRKERLFSVFKRRRKSCDVRVRSTLLSLFSKEDDECKTQNVDSSSIIQRTMNEDEHEERESIVLPVEIENDDDEITVVEEPSSMIVTGNVIRQRSTEMMEEELENEMITVGGDKKEQIFKTTMEQINLDSNAKKSFRRNFKEIARSFSTVTSIFNKKLRKWRKNKNIK